MTSSVVVMACSSLLVIILSLEGLSISNYHLFCLQAVDLSVDLSAASAAEE